MGKGFIAALATVFLAATLVFAQSTPHSVEMGNMECITCHADADMVENPEVAAEWSKSIHSYAGVGCGTCHGDAKDFIPAPGKQTCEPCHTKQVATTKSVLPCARCHVVHTFKVHE